MDAFILVDPVQDYEESLQILGVYPTLEEAMSAGDAFITTRSKYDAWRDVEVRHWVGAEEFEADQWCLDPKRGSWLKGEV